MKAVLLFGTSEIDINRGEIGANQPYSIGTICSGPVSNRFIRDIGVPNAIAIRMIKMNAR
jgi:hypothetical protein